MMTIQLPDRRSGPRAGCRAHLRTVGRNLAKADVTICRLIMALASLFWGVGALLHPETFSHTPYALLEGEVSGWTKTIALTFLFWLHMAGAVWRFVDPVERVGWALIVNGYGLVVWVTTTGVLAFSLRGLTAGTSSEWALCVVAAWALFRTGAEGGAASA